MIRTRRQSINNQKLNEQQSEQKKTCRPDQQSEFSFQLIKEIDLKLETTTYTISIKQNNKIIVASEGCNIKIFQLSNLALKQIQIFMNNEYFVTTSCFLKKKPLLITGSEDETITIWPSNLFSQNKFLIKLKGHQNHIRSIIAHPTDQLIISGGADYCIRFWSTQKNFKCIQVIDEQRIIYCLSINQQGNQLISCGEDNYIFVRTGSENQRWLLKQRINANRIGYRLCFLSTNSFVFQPNFRMQGKNTLYIYSLDCFDKYIIQEQVAVSGGDQYCTFFFPSKFIPLKQILINKNGQTINIIQVSIQEGNKNLLQNQCWKFTLKQSIEYGKGTDGNIFGTVSDDGEFLISWDDESKSIQVRQYLAN
ncbi:unnamed protein product [Paramecium octaurelia]|uniref:Uncharacterized protein n=1 Tax=Paramecium octaurelia TaxID=43137 RepID=A0A8S1WAM4_PAROT|nr:unnamed protein product [Paramecium octaurelia]CAD8185624.1 unnamed protein product [Paramecium octaurelia]